MEISCCEEHSSYSVCIIQIPQESGAPKYRRQMHGEDGLDGSYSSREVVVIPRLTVVTAGLPSPRQTSDICEYLGLILNVQGSTLYSPKQ